MEEKMRFTELVNAEVILVENGHARLELTVDRLHWSSADRLHGGVLFTLLDTALGRAVVSTLDEGPFDSEIVLCNGHQDIVPWHVKV